MDAISNRRANRVTVSRECMMVSEFGEERPAKIIDISKTGFRLKASDCPDAGDCFRMLIDGYDFRCQVVWTHFGEIGGVFLEYVELDNQASNIMENEQSAQSDRRSIDRRSTAERRQSEAAHKDLPNADRRVTTRRTDAQRDSGTSAGK